MCPFRGLRSERWSLRRQRLSHWIDICIVPGARFIAAVLTFVYFISLAICFFASCHQGDEQLVPWCCPGNLRYFCPQKDLRLFSKAFCLLLTVPSAPFSSFPQDRLLLTYSGPGIFRILLPRFLPLSMPKKPSTAWSIPSVI